MIEEHDVETTGFELQKELVRVLAHLYEMAVSLEPLLDEERRRCEIPQEQDARLGGLVHLPQSSKV